jgi:hypothetical protein
MMAARPSLAVLEATRLNPYRRYHCACAPALRAHHPVVLDYRLSTGLVRLCCYFVLYQSGFGSLYLSATSGSKLTVGYTANRRASDDSDKQRRGVETTSGASTTPKKKKEMH